MSYTAGKASPKYLMFGICHTSIIFSHFYQKIIMYLGTLMHLLALHNLKFQCFVSNEYIVISIIQNIDWQIIVSVKKAPKWCWYPASIKLHQFKHKNDAFAVNAHFCLGKWNFMCKIGVPFDSLSLPLIINLFTLQLLS